MADSKRLEILKTIASSLAAIRIANGYNFDFSTTKVTRVFVPIDKVDLTNMPFSIIESGPAEYTPLTSGEYTAGSDRYSLDGWNVLIYGYVNANTDIDRDALLQDQVEKYIEDVVKKLMADVSLGLSYVRHIYYRGVMPYADDLKRNVTAILLRFEVKYDFEVSAP